MQEYLNNNTNPNFIPMPTIAQSVAAGNHIPIGSQQDIALGIHHCMIVLTEGYEKLMTLSSNAPQPARNQIIDITTDLEEGLINLGKIRNFLNPQYLIDGLVIPDNATTNYERVMFLMDGINNSPIHPQGP